MSPPLEEDAAGGGRNQPHDRLERRRFAGPVAAEQRDDLAGLGLEGDTMQDLRSPVVDIERLDLKASRASAITTPPIASPAPR